MLCFIWNVGLESGKIAKYVVDFPTDDLIGVPNVIHTPHLASGTYEAEDNCAIMASEELRDYLLYGNIKNSVNFPDCSLGLMSTIERVCVVHKNQPTILNQVTEIISSKEININNMISKNKGDYAYAMLDICDEIWDKTIAKLQAIDGVVKVTVLKK